MVRFARPLAFALLSVAAAAACGGSSNEPRNAAQQAQIDQATMQQRLRGVWRLADWRPEVPLEATFQALLQQQIQSMQIRFEDGRLVAQSPSIRIDRRYVLSDVAGNQFKLIATDENGVSLASTCEMSPDSTKIMFHGDTEPWRGYGTIVRVQ